MAKYLITILLLLACFRLVADTKAFVYKYDFAKCAEQEEEKQEIKEQGKTKYDSDDKMCCSLVSGNFLIFIPIKSSKISLQQDTYIGFIDKPHTPPPNLLFPGVS